jgi:citrate synthase
MLLSARETAELLGIKLDTLYAYVSRRLLNSIEVAGSRERHYDADEIERFHSARGAGRRGRAPAEALMPLIGSAICLIENHRLYYRGHDALALAQTATLEEAAEILWGIPDPGLLRAGGKDGSRARPPTRSAVHGEKEAYAARRGEGQAQHGVIERCQLRLAELSAVDLAALDLTSSGVVRTGGVILTALAACVGAHEPSTFPVHRQLAAAWRLDPPASDLVRRCLVLLADHELNASTFVARCIASTGATPYAVVSGALAALSGRRHGGASARVEALCRELRDAADPVPAMAARLARDEALPGLGQPLYPDGDPRAVAILISAKEAVPARAEWIENVADAAVRLTGEQPNVDFGLGIAASVLDLPPGSALGLFLVARSAGWIAHAIEQYGSGVLIRPRARYTGRRPELA